MTVLVVDDNDSYRADLIDFLQKQDDIQIIGQARDGLEAMSLTHTLNPDLVMIDISMPGVGGLEATRHIKEYRPDTKVVFVTIHEERTYQILADILQADGFVCKSSAKRDIPKVLRKIRSGLVGK
ncbi:DNA-binding response regulator [bacterium]|nr:MAG: DNA-binding response regulator [bacterium]